MTRYCGECNYTDGMVYTSLPSQVKCTITNKYHLCDHVCDVDFMPVIRCKDCKHQDDGMCFMHHDYGEIVFPNGYCNYGKPKEVYNDTFVNKKLSKKDFMMIHCNNCGSQRCEGIDSDWFEGCKYKNRLKMEDGE